MYNQNMLTYSCNLKLGGKFIMAKSIFINRKKELHLLTLGLKRINDFILIAPRRFGKTALSYKVLDEIKNSNDFIVISMDLMAYTGDSVRNIAEGIIEKCLNALGILGKLRLLLRQVDFSLNLKLRYNDLELEPIVHLFREAQPDDEWRLLEEALQLPEKIAIKTKKKVVVFYDEFGELANMNEKIIRVFRSVLQLHKNTSYLFAGSQETLMNKIFVEKSGAFYRFGQLVFLQELTKEDIYDYMQANYPNISFSVVSEVVALTKGHPYYTAQILEHFIYNEQYYADINNFYTYISQVLIPQEHAYIELQLLKIKERVNALEALRVISLGLNPYSEIRSVARQNLLKTLTSLEAMGYIRKNGRANYNLTDPILGFYLNSY